MDIRYSYTHVPTIREFAASNARVRGLMGPFRSGKTSGCIIEIVRRALAQQRGPDGIRRTRWLAIRNTFPQLNDTTIQSTLMWLPPQYFGRYYPSDHRYLVKGFEGVEFEIWFRALDRPDHVQNLLSLEVTGAWVNSARSPMGHHRRPAGPHRAVPIHQGHGCRAELGWHLYGHQPARSGLGLVSVL
jgi:hypothetical protein